MNKNSKVQSPHIFMDAVSAEAERIINDCATAYYTATQFNKIAKSADVIISTFSLKISNIRNVMKICDSYEKLIDRKYGTKIHNLQTSPQEQLNRFNVPQKTQVILGILDLVIGQVLSQYVKFANM